MGTLQLRFERWWLGRKERRIIAEINRQLKKLRRLEAQGVLSDGLTEELVRAINSSELCKTVRYSFAAPLKPTLYWWDGYIVPVSWITNYFIREDYLRKMVELITMRLKLAWLYRQQKEALKV